MALLSDSAIIEEMKEGNIIIRPFFRDCLGSNSYDVHLGKILMTYSDEVIDAKRENATQEIKIPPEGFVLEPNKFYLASTKEYTETYGLVPFLEGKSSMGRLGISIHETAGKGDAGFRGYWTLEMRASHRVRIYEGMPIGQIIYQEVQGDILNPYYSKETAKYSDQGSIPVASRMWKNYGVDPLWRDHPLRGE